MAEEADTKPQGPRYAQFKVLAPETGRGAKVLFNGQEIQGVHRVEFSNSVDVEEATRCTITLHLGLQVIEAENIAPPKRGLASGGPVGGAGQVTVTIHQDGLHSQEDARRMMEHRIDQERRRGAGAGASRY